MEIIALAVCCLIAIAGGFGREIYTAWVEWQYREYRGDDVCCCGETMGTGGSICAHGGCRSAYEYAVTSRVERVWGKRR